MNAMKQINIADVACDSFTTVSKFDGRRLTVRMRGNADIDALPLLKPFIAALDTEAVQVRAQIVELDLDELYFMNSSCLSILSTWIRKLSTSTGGPTYRIEFRANEKLRWQKRSLHVLCCFGQNLVTIAS